MSYLLSLKCGNTYIHNNRMRFTDRFYCSDCGKFVYKDSLEYFMTEGISTIWMSIWNAGIPFKRGETDIDISKELKHLLKRLDDKRFLRTLNEDECIEFMQETYKILRDNKLTGQEATLTL